MRALRVLVADDELLARKRVARLVSAMEGVELVGMCETGDEVLARVAEIEVDVVLLDIHMPGLSGLDAIALLPKDGPIVIFTTAHAEHAVEAFDQGAVDYVLKPVEAGRLAKALDRARTRALAPRVQRVPVQTRKGVVLLSPDEISHAVVDGELVTIFTDRGPFTTDFRLVDLEARLPGDRFLRVHRQGLINLDRLVRLEPTDVGGYVAHMRDESRVTVSRASARGIRRLLGL